MFCYRNLTHKSPVVYSVRSNRSGLVVARSEYVVIKDAKLLVSKAGRANVLKNRRKNVHAGVKGTWVRGDFKQHIADWRTFHGIYDNDGRELKWVKILYNPYYHDTFVVAGTHKPVFSAETVILDSEGAWALDPK